MGGGGDEGPGPLSGTRPNYVQRGAAANAFQPIDGKWWLLFFIYLLFFCLAKISSPYGYGEGSGWNWRKVRDFLRKGGGAYQRIFQPPPQGIARGPAGTDRKALFPCQRIPPSFVKSRNPLLWIKTYKSLKSIGRCLYPPSLFMGMERGQAELTEREGIFPLSENFCLPPLWFWIRPLWIKTFDKSLKSIGRCLYPNFPASSSHHGLVKTGGGENGKNENSWIVIRLKCIWV